MWIMCIDNGRGINGVMVTYGAQAIVRRQGGQEILLEIFIRLSPILAMQTTKKLTTELVNLQGCIPLWMKMSV
jgi:hypothetical protein